MNGYVSKAQKAFYDTKQDENGRPVSTTKYVARDFGFYEKESISYFTYDGKGDLLKKEVYVWNPAYKLDNKTCRQYPDYSEKNWTPRYSILWQKDSGNNFVSIELFVWNTVKKSYGEAKEKAIYQLNDSNRFNYLAFQKGDEYVEQIN